jgi:Raffinose synthase or seed imbibition protein Sip1
MAHSPRHLLGWHALSTSNAIRPMRSSDDYFPHIPGSHAYHIYTNIVASQFLSCFSIPDFDMFQTHAFVGGDTNLPPQGGFHGSLRALGNGPVTITDVMNHCDKDVFMKLAGKGKHGTIALNAENPLELLDDRCFDNVAQRGDGMGIRGYSKSEWGIMMGIWNVREDGGLVKDSVSMEDVAFAFGSGKVLCWSHRQQALFRLPDHPPDKFTLKELEFEILTLVEIRDQPVCLGLIDKYNTLSAIEARIGNKWRFKCAGSAVFVLPGPDEFVPMIEVHRVSAETWRVGEYTVMKVDLQEHASLYPDADSLWSLHLCYS